MNLGVVFFVLGLSLGHVQAIDRSNPECVDLENLQSSMTRAIGAAGGSAKCKPNSNCTGLECSGKMKDKPFHGTVVLEGCHDPVRMLVHVNGKSLYVQNGYRFKLTSKPTPIYLQVYLKKEDDAVFVTLKGQFCFATKCFSAFTILDNQKIRVQCNGSRSVRPTMSYFTNDTTPNMPTTRPKSGNTGGGQTVMYYFSKDQKHYYISSTNADNSLHCIISLVKCDKPTSSFTYFTNTAVSPRVHAKDRSNPECADFENLRSSMERVIGVAGSSAKCKRNNNCTGLECSGELKDKPFHGTVVLEGCHEPVRMLIHVNKKRLHVQNGYRYKFISKPTPFYLHVNLEKKDDVVFVTLKTEFCIAAACFPAVTILNNQKIRVHCNGSRSVPPTAQNMPFSSGHKSGNTGGKSSGKSLSGGAIGGIVVGVVVFFVILIVVIVWIVHGKRQRVARYNDLAMNDDTDPLCFDSNPIA